MKRDLESNQEVSESIIKATRNGLFIINLEQTTVNWHFKTTDAENKLT